MCIFTQDLECIHYYEEKFQTADGQYFHQYKHNEQNTSQLKSLKTK